MNKVKNGRYEDGYNSVYWYRDNLLHREDGPAIEGSSGEKQWFLNGVEYSKEEFNQWLEKYQLNKK